MYDDHGEVLTATGTAGASSFAYAGDGLPSSRTDAAGHAYDSELAKQQRLVR